MRQTARQSSCERARTWLSSRLDGELSEIESALLDAHLGRCDACRSAAAVIETVTLALRSAPPEVPSRPFAIPRAPRGRESLRAFYGAAAATLGVVAILTGLGSFGAVHVVANTATQPQLPRVSAVAGSSDDLQLLGGIRVLRNERPLPGHIVWPA